MGFTGYRHSEDSVKLDIDTFYRRGTRYASQKTGPKLATFQALTPYGVQARAGNHPLKFVKTRRIRQWSEPLHHYHISSEAFLLTSGVSVEVRKKLAFEL